MNSDCTLILITHNHPRYLERVIPWCLDSGYPVIIADSSDAEWSNPTRSNPAIDYIYRRGGLEVFTEKLRDAVAHVKTPFVFMCDDDDFFLPEGIAVATEFLKAHADYSFAQGYTYYFQSFDDRVALWPIPFKHDNTSDAWIDRVERAAELTVFYGVNRTAILCEALEFILKQNINKSGPASITFLELCLSSIAARRGKMKRVPVPSTMREYGGAAFSDGTRLATIISRDVPDFYRNLLDYLSTGENSEAVRTRLMRHFSQNYAGILNYDLRTRHSKKRFLGALPRKLRLRLEYYFRLIQGARGYATAYSLPLLNIYRMPIYRRFRDFALRPGDRVRD